MRTRTVRAAGTRSMTPSCRATSSAACSARTSASEPVSSRNARSPVGSTCTLTTARSPRCAHLDALRVQGRRAPRGPSPPPTANRRADTGTRHPPRRASRPTASTTPSRTSRTARAGDEAGVLAAARRARCGRRGRSVRPVAAVEERLAHERAGPLRRRPGDLARRGPGPAAVARGSRTDRATARQTAWACAAVERDRVIERAVRFDVAESAPAPTRAPSCTATVAASSSGLSAMATRPKFGAIGVGRMGPDRDAEAGRRGRTASRMAAASPACPPQATLALEITANIASSSAVGTPSTVSPRSALRSMAAMGPR